MYDPAYKSYLDKANSETEGRTEITSPLQGEQEMGLLLNLHRVSVCPDEKVLEIGGCDGCTTG